MRKVLFVFFLYEKKQRAKEKTISDLGSQNKKNFFAEDKKKMVAKFVIPADTLMKNVLIYKLPPVRVRLLDASFDIDCEILLDFTRDGKEKKERAFVCNQSGKIVVVKSNSKQPYIRVGDQTLEKVLFEFVEYEIPFPILIPFDYIYPYGINVPEEPSWSVVINNLINEYFNLNITFDCLSSCLSLTQVDFKGVLVYDQHSNHTYSLQKEVVMGEGHSNNSKEFYANTESLLFNFVEQTIFVYDNKDFLRPSNKLLLPILVYGQTYNSSSVITTKTYECYGPIAIQNQAQHFKYEQSLKKQIEEFQYHNKVTLDPIGLSAALNFVPLKKQLFSSFIEDIKRLVSNNSCFLHLIHLYEQKTETERHLFAKQFAYQLPQYIEYKNNFLINQRDPLLYNLHLEEDGKEIQNDINMLESDLRPTFLMEIKTFKELDSILASKSVTTATKLQAVMDVLNMLIRNQKQEFTSLYEQMQLRIKLSNIQKDLKSSVETKQNQLLELTNKKNVLLSKKMTISQAIEEEHQLLVYLDHQPFLSDEQQLLRTQLVESLYKRFPSTEYKTGEELWFYQKKQATENYFESQCKQYFGLPIPNANIYFNFLKKKQKLLWFYLSIQPSYPSVYDIKSFKGFLLSQQPTCLEAFLKLLDENFYDSSL